MTCNPTFWLKYNQQWYCSNPKAGAYSPGIGSDIEYGFVHFSFVLTVHADLSWVTSFDNTDFALSGQNFTKLPNYLIIDSSRLNAENQLYSFYSGDQNFYLIKNILSTRGVRAFLSS